LSHCKTCLEPSVSIFLLRMNTSPRSNDTYAPSRIKHVVGATLYLLKGVIISKNIKLLVGHPCGAPPGITRVRQPDHCHSAKIPSSHTHEPPTTAQLIVDMTPWGGMVIIFISQPYLCGTAHYNDQQGCFAFTDWAVPCKYGWEVRTTLLVLKLSYSGGEAEWTSTFYSSG
jgi:hypothetical protein